MSLAASFNARLLAQLDALRVNSTRRFAGQIPGERLGPRHGASLEFVDYRAYSPGDDPLRIDWHAYARLDRLVLKLFAEESDLSVHLVLDTSASMSVGDPSKLAHASAAVAALAYVALHGHERVTVGLLAGDTSTMLPTRSGPRQFFEVLKFLDGARAEGAGDLGRSLRHYAGRLRAPGIVVVLSDLLEGAASYSAGLDGLLARGFETHVVQVLAREEREPSLSRDVRSGDVRLVDLEVEGDASGVEVRVDGQSLRRYRERLDRHCEQARRFCLRRGAGYCLTDTGTPIADLMMRQLREARLLS